MADVIRTLIALHVLVPQDPNLLISTKEAAPLIGFDEDTIKKHRAMKVSCTPAYHKIGHRAVRYKLADILAYQAKHRIQPSTETE